MTTAHTDELTRQEERSGTGQAGKHPGPRAIHNEPCERTIMETTQTTRIRSVADTLLDAALYIEAYGWCQDNHFEEVPGTLPRACMLGAIKVVADPSGHRYGTGFLNPAFQRAVNYLADFLDDGIYRNDVSPAEVVWKFNDHPDSTQHLITHALRAAAKRARAELNSQAVSS